MVKKESILSKGEIINNTYEVQFYIGEGAFGEVYRVKHKYLGLQVLKILKNESFEKNQLSSLINEANLLSKLSHPNIVRVFEANEFTKNEQVFYFISMAFVSGETIAQRLFRKKQFEIKDAISIQLDLLNGLKYLHSQQNVIIHRDINLDNVLLSYADRNIIGLLSDFGLAQSLNKNNFFSDSAGRYLYFAPECFWGSYFPSSDVFSSGIVLYQMITGKHPWEYNFDFTANSNFEEISTAIIKSRKKKVLKPSKLKTNCPSFLYDIILKSIDLDLENRFNNAIEFFDALNVELKTNTHKPSNNEQNTQTKKISKKTKGNGFDDIAGMSELKEILYDDIISPLKDKDLHEQYRVSVPNGMLLYGPPGCGKTFISRKFAEEVEFNFIEIKPSDLASIYVHGTQEKIGKVFDEARENAPTIIFIDELDAILPNREGNLSHSYAREVNEFLAQMTECHEDGIFIIAATNRPEKIDPAILRTGRLDKIIYLPPPDFEARLEMFKLHLQDRPLSDSINYEELSVRTENYVSSDINFLVNEAARNSLKQRVKINQDIILKAITNFPPSISINQIKKYEKFKNDRNFI
jgi:transitional endoplasmic reticulum ATPase